MTWVNRLMKLAPIGSIAMELVRFDTQLMENPEISGVAYQQGTLAGYEVREYLLEKWGRKCAYCGVVDVPLEIEHIHPVSKGGSDRVSNLSLACHPCNQKKCNQDIKVFLAKKPEVLQRILRQAKAPLKDAAAVNSTRWALFNALKKTGLSVTTGTGGQTKFNRTRLELPKAHWIDAACVGNVETLELVTTQPLLIKCMGHGNRQMVANDKYGFPRKGYAAKQKIDGWKTGDIVNVVGGKNVGLRNRRISGVRFSGSFSIRAGDKILSVSRNHLKKVHSQDGYDYSFI